MRWLIRLTDSEGQVTVLGDGGISLGYYSRFMRSSCRIKTSREKKALQFGQMISKDGKSSWTKEV